MSKSNKSNNSSEQNQLKNEGCSGICNGCDSGKAKKTATNNQWC